MKLIRGARESRRGALQSLELDNAFQEMIVGQGAVNFEVYDRDGEYWRLNLSVGKYTVLLCH